MKTKIANLLKYNKTFYTLYYYCFSAFINLLRIFIASDDKLILFNSFAGRKYDDSPRVLFESMKNDDKYEGYKFVWAFHDPDKFDVEGAESIKTDNLHYFITALKARTWITNSSVERGLGFRGKNTIYLNTWHGTPMKKMGSDINENNKSFKAKGKSNVDIMLSQGQFETEVFSRTFGIEKEKFLEVGLPRNDELAYITGSVIREKREKLGLSDDKIIILYCPTFREYKKDNMLNVVMTPPLDLEKWEREMKDKYMLLVRAHYEVAKGMNIQNNDFVRDVTDYSTLNDLIIASDILISDYSSVFFDYSITEKPMFHFTYDYDQYAMNRGLYFDIRDYLSGADNEDDLIKAILNMNIDAEKKKSRIFRDKYVTAYGSAAKKTLDALYRRLNQ